MKMDTPAAVMRRTFLWKLWRRMWFPAAITGPNVGKTCVPLQRTFNDGTQFDSSYDRGEPLEFICGAGQMIKGFDAAVANMEVGQVVDVHLMPEEAYGMPNPDAILLLRSHSFQVLRILL